MPIERLESDATDDPPEPGQEAYEALGAVMVEADEVTLMGLFAALQAGTAWERVPPRQRELCRELEAELFDEDEGV